MRGNDIKKLAPNLRLIGIAEGIFVPKFHAEKSEKLNRIIRRLLQGKWFGRHSIMRENSIKRSDESRLRILIVHPKEHKSPSPGLLWMHGGGYGIGIPEQDYGYMDRFASAGNCVVVSPDYRLSCKEPYPAALQDCYLTLKWMKENAHKQKKRNGFT